LICVLDQRLNRIDFETKTIGFIVSKKMIFFRITRSSIKKAVEFGLTKNYSTGCYWVSDQKM